MTNDHAKQLDSRCIELRHLLGVHCHTNHDMERLGAALRQSGQGLIWTLWVAESKSGPI